MYTSVYLSNSSIQVAVGKMSGSGILVEGLYETNAPEGSIINGIITGEEALASHLRNFWRENRLPRKNVVLVINSSQLGTRVLQVPVMGKKDTLAYLPREFAPAGYGGKREEEPEAVYGYFELGRNREKKRRELFVVRAEREFLDSYLQLFAGIGVGVAAVHTAIGCVVQAMRKNPAVRDKTCIIQVLDGDNLNSIFLEEGRYVYSGINRIFSGRESADFGMEVAGSVNGILQFAAAEKIKTPVTDVFWAGFSEDDREGCRESLEQIAPALQTGPVPEEGNIRCRREAVDWRDCLFAVCALAAGREECDLYLRYRKTSAGRKKRRRLLYLMAPVLAVFAICLVITAALAVRYLQLHGRLQEVAAYNTSQEVLEGAAEYDSLLNRIAEWQREKEISLAAGESIASYPTFNSSVEEVFDRCGAGLVTVSVVSFDAQTGNVQVDAEAGDVEAVNRFIARLEQENIFQAVDYTGYSFSEQDNYWSVNLVCTLAENAGK